jgi:pentapeptide MXKDX repeat protein
MPLSLSRKPDKSFRHSEDSELNQSSSQKTEPFLRAENLAEGRSSRDDGSREDNVVREDNGSSPENGPFLKDAPIPNSVPDNVSFPENASSPNADLDLDGWPDLEDWRHPESWPTPKNWPFPDCGLAPRYRRDSENDFRPEDFIPAPPISVNQVATAAFGKDSFDKSASGKSAFNKATFDENAFDDNNNNNSPKESRAPRESGVNPKFLSSPVDRSIPENDLGKNLPRPFDEGLALSHSGILASGPKKEIPEREIPEREIPEREILEREIPEREIPEKEIVEWEIPKREIVEWEIPKREIVEREIPNVSMETPIVYLKYDEALIPLSNSLATPKKGPLNRVIRRIANRPSLNHAFSALSARLSLTPPKNATAPPLKCLFLFSLGIIGLFAFLSISWPAILLISLPFLAGLGILAKNSISTLLKSRDSAKIAPFRLKDLDRRSAPLQITRLNQGQNERGCSELPGRDSFQPGQARPSPALFLQPRSLDSSQASPKRAKAVSFNQQETPRQEPLNQVILDKDLLAKDLMANDLMANDLIAKDLIAKDLIPNDLIAKDLIAKNSMTQDPMAQDPIAQDSFAQDPLDQNRENFCSNALSQNVICPNILCQNVLCQNSLNADILCQNSLSAEAFYQSSLNAGVLCPNDASRINPGSSSLYQKNSDQKDPVRHPKDRRRHPRVKNPGVPQIILAFFISAFFVGCAGLSAKNADPINEVDPAIAKIGRQASGVLWRREKLAESPGYPIRHPVPKGLARPAGLSLPWSGSAEEAVRALAKSLGYSAKIEPEARLYPVELRPDPLLTPFDHIRILNKSLNPKARALVDPINRTLTLKVQPF